MDIPVNSVEMEEIAPEEAFSILGNETRMEILRVLWQAEGPYSFSELRTEAAPDDEGNLNYHLGKLTPHFVRRTDDGYVLRFAGEQVVRAVLTGTITSDPTIPPEPTAEECLYCGTAVEMTYREEVISVQCPECDGAIGGTYPDGTCMQYEFPPAGLANREREEIIDAAHVLYDSKIAPMMKGVCPECAGQVSISHDVCSDHERDDREVCPSCETRYAVWAQYQCENCRYARQFPPWYVALNHPAVIAFLYRHGLAELVPVRKITGDNAKFMRRITETVVETDPYRFEVTVPVEGETLVVSLNDDHDVLTATVTDDDGE